MVMYETSRKGDILWSKYIIGKIQKDSKETTGLQNQFTSKYVMYN